MPAVYGGFVDKFPLGAFMEKGLTPETGQVQGMLANVLPARLLAAMRRDMAEPGTAKS